VNEPWPPPNGNEPFFGVSVLVFLVWALGHHLVRRERRPAFYVPFAALAVIFASYVRAPGFAWRYCGDFWPLLALVGAHYVHALPRAANRFLGLRLALVLLVCTVGGFRRYVTPSLPTIEMLDASGERALASDFLRARYDTGLSSPARVECGRVPRWPYQNGLGWNADCSVDTFTNFFVGVSATADGAHEVRFETEGMSAPALRLYLNGRIYEAARDGERYVAHVRLDPAALHTPTVMGTIEWASEASAEPGRLIAIEIV
jgi:hypothetical protein